MTAERGTPAVAGGEVVRRSALALALTLLVVTGMAALGAGGSHRGTAAAASATASVAPVWYLAVGDSLAAGVGATSPAAGYVGDVYAKERATFTGLRVADLGCSGATTTSMMEGGGCTYRTGTQLGEAEAFLAAHRGRVAFVTIDLGINDVDGCVGPQGTDASCLAAGMAAVRSRLPEIVAGLQGADPGVAVFGLDYYDPFLGWWATGDATHRMALATVGAIQTLDATLGQIYGRSASFVDVSAPFHTGDTAAVGVASPGSPDPATPVEVVTVCRLTLECSEGNLHPNDAGHAVLAAAVEEAITGYRTDHALPGG